MSMDMKRSRLWKEPVGPLVVSDSVGLTVLTVGILKPERRPWPSGGPLPGRAATPDLGIGVAPDTVQQNVHKIVGAGFNNLFKVVTRPARVPGMTRPVGRGVYFAPPPPYVISQKR